MKKSENFQKKTYQTVHTNGTRTKGAARPVVSQTAALFDQIVKPEAQPLVKAGEKAAGFAVAADDSDGLPISVILEFV